MRRIRNRDREREASPTLYDSRAFEVTSAELDALLYRLCVEMDFCLSPQATRSLWESRPATVDEFVDALFCAEGLEHDTRRTLRTDIKLMTQQFIAARRAP